MRIKKIESKYLLEEWRGMYSCGQHTAQDIWWVLAIMA